MYVANTVGIDELEINEKYLCDLRLWYGQSVFIEQPFEQYRAQIPFARIRQHHNNRFIFAARKPGITCGHRHCSAR